MPEGAKSKVDSWCLGRRHSLTCYKDLDWLIQYLNQDPNLLVPICDWKQPRYLFAEDRRCDVLFLDLRLWEDENKKSRSTEIQKILCAAKRLLGSTSPKKVSPEFARAFEAARKTCDDSEKFSPEALTLLPLLLSHVDRTLPIVLFTSSHQRVVLEMLRDCPNVITSFAKPLISGYGEPVTPSRSISDLEDAIVEAINLHEARIAWKRISKLEPQQRSFSYGDQRHPKKVMFDREKLRARIGMLFERCLYMRGPFSPFEEIDKPWELLEELVVQTFPSQTLGSPQPAGDVAPLALALKENRNARTHGELITDQFDLNPDRTRQVLVLQLLFLLDFLENKEDDRCFAAWNTGTSPTGKGLCLVLYNLAHTVSSGNCRKWLDKRTESALTELWKNTEKEASGS